MRSMKRRNHSKPKPTAPPADLLVCFPARAHLTLLPSPARAPAEPHRRHHRKAQPSYSQPSPLPWAKEMSSEPTSPKVTCAGQIKIRPHAHRSTKNWQSVMEEIERIHNKKKLNQNSLGFKGEIVNFLSCLRGFRFDFRCFRGFPQSDITTEDEEEEEEEEEEEAEPESESESEQEPIEDSSRRGRTMFSEWFMVLQEEETKPKNNDVVSSLEFQPSSVSVPPPNALLLMRCRSAPNSLLRKPKQEEEEEEEEEEEAEKQSKISLKLLMEEEKEVVVAKKKSLMVMDYDADFYKLSSDIAKETWVVSGSSNSKCNDDPLLRSRSWKK